MSMGCHEKSMGHLIESQVSRECFPESVNSNSSRSCPGKGVKIRGERPQGKKVGADANFQRQKKQWPVWKVTIQYVLNLGSDQGAVPSNEIHSNNEFECNLGVCRNPLSSILKQRSNKGKDILGAVFRDTWSWADLFQCCHSNQGEGCWSFKLE